MISFIVVVLCDMTIQRQLDLQLLPLGGLLGNDPEKGLMDDRREKNDFSFVNKMKLRNDDLPLDTRIYIPPSQHMEDFRTYYDVDDS